MTDFRTMTCYASQVAVASLRQDVANKGVESQRQKQPADVLY